MQVIDDGTESNETRLGAVRDVQMAIERLNLNDDLLVIAGDNVLDFSLSHFIGYFAQKKASCIMRYYCDDVVRLRKGGVIEPAEDGLILRMEEKPAEPFACWCAPPFYVYAKQDLHFVDEALSSGCGADAPGSFMAWLSKHAPVYAMEMPGSRYDIGNMASYEAVQREYAGIVK